MKKGSVVRPADIFGEDYDSFSRFLMSVSVGDTVLIKSTSSICHSLNELFDITLLAKGRGIIIKSATESWYDTSRADFDRFLTDVCARYKISQSTLYRYIHFNKLELKQL